MTIKLEVGHTYLTEDGTPHTIRFSKRFWLMMTAYRELEYSDVFWHESGEHSSGDDSLRLRYEYKALPVATPAPTPAPASIVLSEPIAAASAGVVRLEIDWTARAVRSVTVE